MDDIGERAAVDPLQVDRGDPAVGVPELALDHIQRDALSGHFNGVGMAQLVRREAAADTGPARRARCRNCVVGGGQPRPSRGGEILARREEETVEATST